MKINLRFGKCGLEVDLPDANVRHVLRMNDLPPLSDPLQACVHALVEPIQSPPLAEIARGKHSACIVVSDITRPVPNEILLPPVLDCLDASGLASDQITVLVATGLHRGNTPEEFTAMGLGEALRRGIRVVNHEARDPASHVLVGTTSLGIPALVDRRYVDAELKILTGLVEPHLMAGFSGGRKAICPGICAADTIMAWHSPRMLEPKEARQGNLTGNRVHEQALEVADLAGGADFIVNCVMDEQRRVTGLFAGDMGAAHLAAVERAIQQTRVTIPRPVDIVVTSAAGYPLDLTFYQGAKGMVGAAPIVREGGCIVIAQENAEGIGGPEFTDLMLNLDDLHGHMRRVLETNESSIDQWQAHVLEKTLRRCSVLNFSTCIDRDTQARLFVEPVSSVEEGVRLALQRLGPDATIAVIPEGPYVLCEVEG
ncbi:MAG: nickel-dependent lactate racemase [Acidobacteriota bacterium]|nr:nickel-dependent lactate racemase [Acidobacteriota bacterium]